MFRLDLTPEQARALADELQKIVDAGLDHPSIVRPIAAGLEGTVAYAASEYVAAESLDIALRHYAPAALDKVLPLVTQLAGALDFARAAGVGHGALHPRDIFVSPDEARATGFGVVQALEQVGVRAPVRRPYTAPERVDGSDWSGAADVYSLASIAYELLTGRRPAGAGSAVSAADIHADHPDLVAAAIAHSLAEDPRARHQSALSFAASLEAAARGERTSAREPFLAVPAVPAEPTAEMRPDGATFLDIPQEPAHDLVIEPFEDVERPSDRELDEIQLRDQHPPDEAGVFELGPRREELRAIEEVPPGEEHVEQPPVGPAGHEIVGTIEREPMLFDVTEPHGVEAQSERETPGSAELQVKPEQSPAPWREPEPQPAAEPEPEATAEPEPPLAPVAPFERSAEPEAARDVEHPRAEVPLRREAPDRQRPVLLPVALTLLLGLFVGFLAGYLVGSRGPQQAAVRPDTTEPVATPPAAAPPAATRNTTPAARAQAPQQKPAPATAVPSQTAAPAPDRATAAPVAGRLAVRSTPSGAQVFVNGRRRGPTPLVVRNLAPGTYTVRLERQGYAPETRRVTLASNGARDLVLTLKRAAPERPATPTTFVGSMYLDSRPRGARVFVDGKAMGETPLQIPEIRAGAHVVRFELAGHRPWSTSASVMAGQVARVTGSLEREQ